MVDHDTIEDRLRLYFTDLAEHAASQPISYRLAHLLRRGEQPQRARIPRTSLVRPLAVIGAAALVAVAAVHLAGRGSTGDGGQGAVLLTAAPVPVRAVLAEPIAGHPGQRQLMLFDSVTRTTRRVGPPAGYDAVRMSPRGDVIAALAGNVLHLVTVVSGADHPVSLPSGSYGGGLVWSQDGSDVAVVGQHVLVANSSGRLVAEVAAPAASIPVSPGVPGRTVIGSEVEDSGGYQWSPDGRRFAAVMNDALIVVGTDGTTAAAPLASLLRGVDSSTFIVLEGWNGSDVIVLGTDLVGPTSATVARGWAVDVAHSLAATAGTDLAFEFTGPPPASAADRAALGRFAPNPQVMYSYRTSDGGADFYEVRPGPPNTGGVATILVVFVRGTTEAIRLPSLTDTRDGNLVDAVLVS